MARWTKLEKRMRARLIDGAEVKMSKRFFPNNEGFFILRFVLSYKGDILINYPQARDSQRENYAYWHGATVLCALLLIDGYFSLKHDVSFNKNARELYEAAYEAEMNRRDPRYCHWISESSYFLETMADDLLLILKVCDKRTGKRSLRKLDIATMKPELQRVLRYRIS